MKNTDFEWTDEAVGRLKELHAKGLSGGQIANQMPGTTRNGCIGKMHRLGLVRPQMPKSKPTAPVAARIEPWCPANPVSSAASVPAPRKPAARPKRTSPPKPAPTGKPCGLMELTFWSCRWPEGDPRHPGFHFCNRKRVDGVPYCAEHVAVAYSRR